MASTGLTHREPGSVEAINRRLFRAIGDFLNAHHLGPTPANYALVYEVLVEPASPAAQAIASATGEGLRLTQSEADRIRRAATAAGDNELRTAGLGPDALAQARRQVEEFSALVEMTRAEAETYGRDLAEGAAALDHLPGPPHQVSDIIRVTGAMLERTHSAERQLQAARAEAQMLRARLAEAEEEARSDPLTRLPNRRAFEDRMAEVVAGGGPVSLAICDIDHFKGVNDTHGHGVGDRVLRMVAEVLRSSCAGHMVARIGGEEFVVLFDGLDPEAAAVILEQARADLAARHFKVRGTDAPLGRITFSAGVVACVAAQGDESPLKRADELLYRAKHSGRNRVVVEAQ